MEYQYRFEKLNVWLEAKELVILVYGLLKMFPAEERYALCDQVRRAVISVPSNIAEGSGRISVKEQVHFTEIAYGSLMELYCQLQISLELGYFTEEDFKPIKQKIGVVGKLLSGYRANLSSKP